MTQNLNTFTQRVSTAHLYWHIPCRSFFMSPAVWKTKFLSAEHVNISRHSLNQPPFELCSVLKWGIFIVWVFGCGWCVFFLTTSNQSGPGLNMLVWLEKCSVVITYVCLNLERWPFFFFSKELRNWLTFLQKNKWLSCAICLRSLFPQHIYCYF